MVAQLLVSPLGPRMAAAAVAVAAYSGTEKGSWGSQALISNTILTTAKSRGTSQVSQIFYIDYKYLYMFTNI